MAYLLFPNRGKYELPDVVFDLLGQTVTPEEERTPWIDRLTKELAPRVEQETAEPYRKSSCRCRRSWPRWKLAGIKIDVCVLERMSRRWARSWTI